MNAGKFKIKRFEDHPPRAGQTWEEKGWPANPHGSKLFLLLGFEGSSVRLLDLETGERDSVHWTTFIRPGENWRRIA